MIWRASFVRSFQTLTVCLVGSISLGAGAAESPDCLVLGITGNWIYTSGNGGGNHDIEFGSALPIDATITCTSRGTLNLLFKGRNPVPYACRASGISTVLKTLQPPEPPGVIRQALISLLDVVAPRIGAEPRTYISAVSRGFGAPELSEAVVQLNGNRCDVAPAFDAMPDGHYAVVLLPLAEMSSDGSPIPVDWRAGSSALIAVPGAKPGLLKIAISGGDGMLSGEAWILLSRAPRAAEERTRFEQAQRIVAAWPGGVHAAASRSVLRAFMRALADGTR